MGLIKNYVDSMAKCLDIFLQDIPSEKKRSSASVITCESMLVPANPGSGRVNLYLRLGHNDSQK